jgi:hypothetical protein
VDAAAVDGHFTGQGQSSLRVRGPRLITGPGASALPGVLGAPRAHAIAPASVVRVECGGGAGAAC